MTASFPTFSVIIPNYNNATTLARAIRSVLTQTWPAHEIIVIDDGSTDNSAEVADQFGHKVRYIFQANAGVSVARNHGAEAATGEWLAFLDADDCFLPDRLEVHANWIRADRGLDFLLGDQDFMTPEGKFMHRSLEHSAAGRRLVAEHPGKENIPMNADDFNDLISDGFAEIRALSVPRERFIALGGFPIGKKIGEDLHFFIRLCAVSVKAGVVNRPLALYYIYPGSAMRKDALGAQSGFVDTLESLTQEIISAPLPVRRGFHEKLRRVRLGLAYTYLREGRKLDAVRAVMPTLLSRPGLAPVRDLISVLRGLPRRVS